ncbi:hypothetical protein OIU85_027467 [Salix viminalis]|uniref:Uncharacterized protein n=1 Tax=Salix viminalis TaxID=40686 RepID=A0A9Q0TA93_SALVM|nr:hypothetical protein OIU85_027467 [Salix viminalis]
MDPIIQEQKPTELFQAHTHVHGQMFNYISSMSLVCSPTRHTGHNPQPWRANHSSSLGLNTAHRTQTKLVSFTGLMRMLSVNSSFFATTKAANGQGEGKKKKPMF